MSADRDAPTPRVSPDPLEPDGTSGGPGVGSALFVLGLATGLFCALVIDRLGTLFLDRDIELVRAVRRLALEEFVHELDPEELVDDALRGMVSGLDRYSRFYGPDEIARLDRETSGEFRGIGVIFRSTEDGQILFPYPGSPAAEAGMRVGDRVVALEGRPIETTLPDELHALLRSGLARLRVRVVGLDGGERELVLEPRRVVDPTVRHARLLDPEHGIGYLAILSFSHRTPAEFDEAVAALREEGLTALVVDLRSNPGGILDAAVQVANRFIREGAIVATRTRTETHVTEARGDEAHLFELPLVVLVDEGSASASEVLAGALQDHCVAALVGEPTYGKGTVQTLERFSDDRAIVKLTTATYYTPSWRSIERDPGHPDAHGISPDLLVELDPDERRSVHVFLATYSPPPEVLPALRAWEAREEVELVVPPPADRQLEAAVALLTGDLPDLVAEPLR